MEKKFRRKEIEYYIIQNLFLDIRTISNQVQNIKYEEITINSRIISSTNMKEILFYRKSTNNKKFINIIDKYIMLCDEFTPIV